MLPQSGDITTLKSGAMKDILVGNGRYDLIPTIGLRRLAKRYEDGARKYEPRNWEKGIPKEVCINSAFRHLIKYSEGLDDEDHLAAVAWWMFALMFFENRGDL